MGEAGRLSNGVASARAVRGPQSGPGPWWALLRSSFARAVLGLVLTALVPASASAAREPTPVEAQAIDAAVHASTQTIAAPDEDFTVQRIRISTAGPWASARLVPRPGSLLSPAFVVLSGDASAWRVRQVGTIDVGCGLAPRAVASDLGLGCPPPGQCRPRGGRLAGRFGVSAIGLSCRQARALLRRVYRRGGIAALRRSGWRVLGAGGSWSVSRRLRSLVWDRIVAAGLTHLYRPRRVFFGAHQVIDRIRWTSWDGPRAVGFGSYPINDCVPDCADGRSRRVRVRVSLSRASLCSGDRVYRKLSWRVLGSPSLGGRPGSWIYNCRDGD